MEVSENDPHEPTGAPLHFSEGAFLLSRTDPYIHRPVYGWSGEPFRSRAEQRLAGELVLQDTLTHPFVDVTDQGSGLSSTLVTSSELGSPTGWAYRLERAIMSGDTSWELNSHRAGAPIAFSPGTHRLSVLVKAPEEVGLAPRLFFQNGSVRAAITVAARVIPAFDGWRVENWNFNLAANEVDVSGIGFTFSQIPSIGDGLWITAPVFAPLAEGRTAWDYFDGETETFWEGLPPGPKVYLANADDSTRIDLDSVWDTNSGIQATDGIRGVGAPDVSLFIDEGAGDGGHYRGERLEPRDIDLPIHILGVDRAHLKELADKLFAIVKKPHKLIFDDGDDEWFLDVHRAGGGSYSYGTDDTKGDNELNMVLTLRAPDPLWRRTTREVIELPVDGSPIEVDFQGEHPAEPEFEIGGSAASIDLSIEGSPPVRWRGALWAGEVMELRPAEGVSRERASGRSTYGGLSNPLRALTVEPGKKSVRLEADYESDGAVLSLREPRVNTAFNPSFRQFISGSSPITHWHPETGTLWELGRTNSPIELNVILDPKSVHNSPVSYSWIETRAVPAGSWDGVAAPPAPWSGYTGRIMRIHAEGNWSFVQVGFPTASGLYGEFSELMGSEIDVSFWMNALKYQSGDGLGNGPFYADCASLRLILRDRADTTQMRIVDTPTIPVERIGAWEHKRYTFHIPASHFLDEVIFRVRTPSRRVRGFERVVDVTQFHIGSPGVEYFDNTRPNTHDLRFDILEPDFPLGGALMENQGALAAPAARMSYTPRRWAVI